MMPFLCIHISQGSVATRLVCGGIFVYDFVTNFLPSLTMKKIENRIIVSEVMARSLVSCFLTQGVVTVWIQKQERHRQIHTADQSLYLDY